MPGLVPEIYRRAVFSAVAGANTKTVVIPKNTKGIVLFLGKQNRFDETGPITIGGVSIRTNYSFIQHTGGGDSLQEKCVYLTPVDTVGAVPSGSQTLAFTMNGSIGAGAGGILYAIVSGTPLVMSDFNAASSASVNVFQQLNSGANEGIGFFAWYGTAASCISGPMQPGCVYDGQRSLASDCFSYAHENVTNIGSRNVGFVGTADNGSKMGVMLSPVSIPVAIGAGLRTGRMRRRRENDL